MAGNENSGRKISTISSERYISFENSVKKFVVYIPFKKKQKNIGRFKKLEDAVLCRDKCLEEFF